MASTSPTPRCWRRDGARRNFFTDAGDFFCPSLDIDHDDTGFEVTFDRTGFEKSVTAVFP